MKTVILLLQIRIVLCKVAPWQRTRAAATENNMNRLLAILANHNMTVLGHTDTTITVEAVYCRDGVAETVPETIAADLGAVRDWLGY